MDEVDPFGIPLPPVQGMFGEQPQPLLPQDYLGGGTAGGSFHSLDPGMLARMWAPYPQEQQPLPQLQPLPQMGV